jgi:hypothetical protein
VWCFYFFIAKEKIVFHRRHSNNRKSREDVSLFLIEAAVWEAQIGLVWSSSRAATVIVHRPQLITWTCALPVSASSLLTWEQSYRLCPNAALLVRRFFPRSGIFRMFSLDIVFHAGRHLHKNLQLAGGCSAPFFLHVDEPFKDGCPQRGQNSRFNEQ